MITISHCFSCSMQLGHDDQRAKNSMHSSTDGARGRHKSTTISFGSGMPSENTAFHGCECQVNSSCVARHTVHGS